MSMIIIKKNSITKEPKTNSSSSISNIRINWFICIIMQCVKSKLEKGKYCYYKIEENFKKIEIEVKIVCKSRIVLVVNCKIVCGI